MKPIVWIVSSVLLVAASLAAGYWWGASRPAAEAPPTAAGKAASGTAPDLARAAPATVAAAKPRILYYRNPMGLPDTSPVPKKDQMGMDYIAVYADEEPASATTLVKLSVDKVQKLGVKTETVALRDLNNTIRAVATVQANERSLYTVTSKFDGWIQRLYVNTTGQAVRKGEALMDVYSPDLDRKSTRLN